MSDSGFTAELVHDDGARYLLSGEMQVGRSDECAIKIDDAKVSRKHAVFRVIGDTVSVEDLGSANGTLVNGDRIEGETRLSNGDSVQFEKHRYSMAITSPASEPDPDATVVNLPDEDATVVNEVSQSTPDEPPSGLPRDLPGSWVDEPGTGEHTQVMDFSADTGNVSAQVERMSDDAHLVVLDEQGLAKEGIELIPSASADPDVWEIGRDQSCELALADDTVSARHAQLVHDEGRWSIVNLVAVNGIFVNGEKRLKAFLSDKDVIQLGNAKLVFRAAVGGASTPIKRPPPTELETADSGATPVRSMPASVVALLIIVALAVFGYLLLG